MNTQVEKDREVAQQENGKVAKTLSDLWWSFLVRGLLAIVLAVCALIWPQQTMTLLTKLLGVYFLIDGGAGLIATLRNSDKRTSLLPAVVGLVAGIVLIFWAAISARVFLLIVGVWAVLQGAGMLLSAWQMKRGDEVRMTVGLVGLAVVVVGIGFVVWPETGIVAVSWLIAVGAAIVGGLLIFLATRLKRARKRVETLGQNHAEAEPE